MDEVRYWLSSLRIILYTFDLNKSFSRGGQIKVKSTDGSKCSPPCQSVQPVLKLVQPTLLLLVTTIHHYLPGFTTIYYGLPRCESTQKKTVMLSIIWKFTNHMIKVMDQSDWPLFEISWIPALYLVQNQILFCIINRTSTKLYFQQNINIQESDRDLIVTMVPVLPSLPQITLQ